MFFNTVHAAGRPAEFPDSPGWNWWGDGCSPLYEITEIDREMRQNGKSRVIIVTSPQHTRRVRVLWTKHAGAGHQAIIRAAFQDPFDARHWWWTTRDTFAVVRELLGLINAWIGLPVRPGSN